jgi:UDP-glucose 4-epimerase
MSSTILVTGGCGYIGSHICLQLAAAGQHVVVVDDLSTGSRESLLNNEVYYRGDCGDRDLLDRIFVKHAIDTVFHLAGSTSVTESVTEPARYYHNNTVVTHNLLAAAVQYGVKNLVFSSTAAVYRPAKTLIRESDPVEPASPYGRSKLMAEWLIRDAALATGLKYVILRYFNVAGADPLLRIGQRSPRAEHLFKVCARAALEPGAAGVTIYGSDYDTKDGTGVRDYIHVVDIASAHLSALRYLAKSGDSVILNCGYGNGYSVKDVVASMRRAGAVEIPVQIAARRPGDTSQVVADASRLRQTFTDWQPQFDDLDAISASALGWETRMARSKL